MGNVFRFDWEVSLMQTLQQLLGSEGGIGTLLAKFFTLLGNEIVVVVIVAFIYWCYNKELAKRMMSVLGASLLVAPMVKNIALRRRPYLQAEDGIKCLAPVDAKADINDIAKQGFSFPSAHATDSVVVYGSLAQIFRKKWLIVLAVVLPLLIALSRVLVGVHYPTDVLVGLVIGAVNLALVSWMWKRFSDHRIVYLILALVGIPGLFYCKTTDFFTGYGVMIGAFAGFLFEERFVKFTSTRSWVQILLRLALGGALYVGLNAVLKLPFDKAWLEADSWGALMVRWARYGVIGFVAFGVYPMLFKYMDKLTVKKE